MMHSKIIIVNIRRDVLQLYVMQLNSILKNECNPSLENMEIRFWFYFDYSPGGKSPLSSSHVIFFSLHSFVPFFASCHFRYQVWNDRYQMWLVFCAKEKGHVRLHNENPLLFLEIRKIWSWVTPSEGILSFFSLSPCLIHPLFFHSYFNILWFYFLLKKERKLEKVRIGRVGIWDEGKWMGAPHMLMCRFLDETWCDEKKKSCERLSFKLWEKKEEKRNRWSIPFVSCALWTKWFQVGYSSSSSSVIIFY